MIIQFVFPTLKPLGLPLFFIGRATGGVCFIEIFRLATSLFLCFLIGIGKF